MDCEICGCASPELFLISIDGVRMQVCNRCKGHGTFISKAYVPPPKREIKIEKEEPEIEIVENYPALIRAGREKRNLDQKKLAEKINEPISLVKKIELEKIIPSEKIAKKIEHALGINLYQEVKSEKVETKKPTSAATFGDIVVVKKKR